jgi:hypothetical protein
VFCDRSIHPLIKSILFITISFTITSTKLCKSQYSPYQEELFTIISKLKEDVFTPLGYRKIAHKLTSEGYLSPYGREITPSIVQSIYNKGKVRLERINRKDIVEVLDTVVKVTYPKIKWW